MCSRSCGLSCVLVALGAGLLLTALICMPVWRQAAELLRESERLEAMHRASLALGVRDATERIYETVLSIMK